jgi:Terminase small subunit
MPVLENHKYELFAQAFAKGETATRAYELAGYKPSRKNASRLKTNKDISARVSELQAASAASAVITIESICAELDQANAVAREKGQAAAMVSASALRAKLAGLLKDRVEVGGPGSFDDCETVEEIVDRLLAGPGSPIEQFRPVDARDRQGLLDLIERHRAEMEEFFENIKSRPQILVRCDLRDLSRPWGSHKLQPYEEAKRLTKQQR